jgi:hypothetical protein
MNEFFRSAVSLNPDRADEPRSLERKPERIADRTHTLASFLPLSLTLEGFHVCGGPNL